MTSTISSDDLADGIERSLNVAVCLVFLVLGGVVAVETVRWLHRSATLVRNVFTVFLKFYAAT